MQCALHLCENHNSNNNAYQCWEFANESVEHIKRRQDAASVQVFVFCLVFGEERHSANLMLTPHYFQSAGVRFSLSLSHPFIACIIYELPILDTWLLNSTKTQTTISNSNSLELANSFASFEMQVNKSQMLCNIYSMCTRLQATRNWTIDWVILIGICGNGVYIYIFKVSSQISQESLKNRRTTGHKLNGEQILSYFCVVVLTFFSTKPQNLIFL